MTRTGKCLSPDGAVTVPRGHVYRLLRYDRVRIRQDRKCLYAFGDNVAGRGFGGQAEEARGEVNAVGIPTKWGPTRSGTAFFTDDDLGLVRDKIDAAFDRLRKHLEAGDPVVWPADGVGTGRADLRTRAPAIHSYIEQKLAELVRE